MKITIDNSEIEVKNTSKNIVQIAKENGITIPAPCLNVDRKFGCCTACIIEVDGKQKYACCTKPEDNMKIIFERNDLKELRKQRMKSYSISKQNGFILPCDCSTDSNNDCCSNESSSSCC
jgi:NADH dehydrogenase/NADH:ubiquinone oxidoreductase subunit G